MDVGAEPLGLRRERRTKMCMRDQARHAPSPSRTPVKRLG
jgi:hypothetical protein